MPAATDTRNPMRISIIPPPSCCQEGSVEIIPFFDRGRKGGHTGRLRAQTENALAFPGGGWYNEGTLKLVVS